MNSEETLNLARRKYPNDENLRVAYMLGLNDGADMKEEQMMKDAVECDVIVPIYEGNDVWSAEIKIPGRYEPGDKIRIIVCKNED